MKTIIITVIAIFATFAAFSQKAKANPDTTLKSYLTYSCPMHPEYVSNVAGKCPKCGSNMTFSKKEQMKAEVVKLYTCPMDNLICTKPGKCPICGMEMVALKPKNKVSKD